MLASGIANYTEYDENWWPAFNDFTVERADQLPIRYKLSFQNGLNDYAVYLGYLNFTKNPSTGIPVVDEDEGWLTPDGKEGSSVAGTLVGDDTFLSWDNQNIYVNNVEVGSEVKIYSITGALVKTSIVSQAFHTIAMERGIYVVKYGTKAVKVNI